VVNVKKRTSHRDIRRQNKIYKMRDLRFSQRRRFKSWVKVEAVWASETSVSPTTSVHFATIQRATTKIETFVSVDHTGCC